jgi:Uma2 family endonuclease
MGMPAPSSVEWTVEMVHALPDDGNRYEVIDGELLVSPAPSMLHQRALAKLHLLLASHAESVGLELLFAPFAITFGPKTEVQPDLVAFGLNDDGSAPDFREPGRLTLAVEVLSPSTARVDQYKKRPLFQRYRVHEYWIVDVGNRLIARWRPDDEEPEVVIDAMSWQPIRGLEPLPLDVVAYFRDVYREGKERSR